MTAKWKSLGVCHVDAAMLLIGDPCYSTHETHPEHPIHNWGAFCDLLDTAPDGNLQLNHPAGHPGAGVVVRTGYDGAFAVEGRFSADGDMLEIRIRPSRG